MRWWRRRCRWLSSGKRSLTTATQTHTHTHTHIYTRWFTSIQNCSYRHYNYTNTMERNTFSHIPCFPSGAWWLSGRFGALRPEGGKFEFHSSHHIWGPWTSPLLI